MWCPNCGREIADGAAFCGYCGRKIQYDGNTDLNEEEQNFGQESPAEDYTESGKNNDPRGERIDSGRYKRPVIIAVIAAVVLATALVTCVFLLPGGSSPNEDPTLAYAEDPGDSEDAGSDDEQGVVYERDAELISSDAGSLTLLDLSEMELTATDSDEALEVLESLSGILNIDDAQEELTLKNENCFSGSSYYRYQQVYEGLTVYGRSIVLAADEDGSVDLLSGNLADMTGAVTEPVIDTAAAIEAAQAYLEEADDGDEASADAPDSSDEAAAEYDAELCYYMAEGTDTPSLSWAVEIGFDTVFVDAAYGIVLGEVSSNSNLTGYNGDGTMEVPAIEAKGLYYLVDEDRNIHIATLDGVSSDETAFQQFLTSDNLYFGDTQEEQELEYDKGIELLSVLQPIYDYYDDNYGETGFGTVIAVYNDGKDFGRNASGGVMSDDYGYLSVGTKMPLDLTDEIGHEYTHIIRFYHIGEATSFESMALSEAFSDIMGILIDASVHGESPDWLMEVEEADVYRDARAPAISDYSELDSLTIINTGNVKRYSAEAKYSASTLITHTAYLMWEGEESAGIEAIDDVDLLAELWYRTMLLLQSDSSFVDCRTACEASAGQMYRLGLLSEEQVSAVIWAFDQAGIYSSAANAAIDSLVIRIHDAGGALTDQYVMTVSDSSGELVETVNGPSAGAAVELTLAQGVYSIVVASTEADYTEEKIAVTVLSQYDTGNVFTWTTTSELEIHTTFGTSLSGQVTDAQGNPLEGVQITVEPAQIGQTQAEQIAQESAAGGSVYSSGQVLALAQQTSASATITTDASGSYSAKLPVGIYQLTLELDGYTTSTVRQVVLSGYNTAETVVLEADNNASELELYAEILDMFYYGISTQWAAWKEADAYYNSSDYPLSYRWYWFDIAETLSDAGFALMDLDGNGVAELLVNTSANDGSSIIDLYTYKDGDVIHLAGDTERCEYWLCADYSIGYQDSASAYSGAYEFWRVDEASDQLLLTESLFYQYKDHDYVQDEQNATWYYSTVGHYGYSFGDRLEPVDEDIISADEAMEVLGCYKRLNYELTLFSEYTPVSDGSEYTSGSLSDETSMSYEDVLTDLAEMFYSNPDLIGIEDWIGDDLRDYADGLDEPVIWALDNGKYLGLYPRAYVYYGDMTDGIRNGEGIWFSSSGFDVGERNNLFVGTWNNDLPNGWGVLYETEGYPMGAYAEDAYRIEKFEINFIDACADGSGTLTYSTANGSGSCSIIADCGKLVGTYSDENGHDYYAYIETLDRYIDRIYLVVPGTIDESTLEIAVSG